MAQLTLDTLIDSCLAIRARSGGAMPIWLVLPQPGGSEALGPLEQMLPQRGADGFNALLLLGAAPDLPVVCERAREAALEALVDAVRRGRSPRRSLEEGELEVRP